MMLREFGMDVLYYEHAIGFICFCACFVFLGLAWIVEWARDRRGSR